jgi:MFS family permease
MTFPVVLTAFALNSNFIVALLLTYLLGVGFMLEFTQINTLLQTRVDDHMRGRVLSLYTLTFFGFAPFGSLLVGALGEAFGLASP